MGAAYAEHGPWLAADPLLHTAERPPDPAAWLFDLALHAVERTGGFQALRALHGAFVAAILAAAWTLLRRMGASALWAAVGVELFAALSAYRLFQLRPHLFTMLATLLVLRWLVVDREPPGWRRVGAGCLLFAVWANVHGGFPVGLALVGAAAAGSLAEALLRTDARDAALARARRLLAALGLCALATLLNPSGAEQHALYFAAGADTPDLAWVSDEWARFAPFTLPLANVPPTPFSWLAVWALGLLTAAVALTTLRRRDVDGSRLAVTAAAFLGLLAAVRLLWLAVVPIGWLAARARGGPLLAAALALVTGVGFARFGDGPLVSRAVSPASYAEPYPANKVDGHAVWFLADAGLRGNLYNEYANGNFLGYWLAPRMRVFLNGSLNVPLRVMDARRAVRRLSPPAGRTLTDLLDDFAVDVFFGSGLPVYPASPRAEVSNVAHLEGMPGWIPVFRNLRSGVYLRDLPRNRENLERVAAYYARAGVPFDATRGFDARLAVERAPRWAAEHGLCPADLDRLRAAGASPDPVLRRQAWERLGRWSAALGLYEETLELADRQLAETPDAVGALRRRVWALLHLRRGKQARRAAAPLAARMPPGDPVSGLLVTAARAGAARPALFPVFAPSEAQQVLAGIRPASARPARP